MKCVRMLLLTAGLAAVTTTGYAGSERWIMGITPARMAEAKFVHIRFNDGNGHTLESEQLKQMVIREEDCANGREYSIPKDYRLGFGPVGRKIGVFLMPQAWEGKHLCFTLPGAGSAVRDMHNQDSGQTLEITLSP